MTITKNGGTRLVAIVIIGTVLLYLALAVAAFSAPTQPVEKNGWVCRTKQQDLELRDWIGGIQKKAREAQLTAVLALKSENEVKAKLGLAKQDGITLAKERDQAILDKEHVLKKLHLAKFIFIGLWLAFMGVIWLKVPLPGPLKPYAAYVIVPVAVAGIGVIAAWL